MKPKQDTFAILGVTLGMLLGPLVVILLHNYGIKSPISDDTITLTLSIFVFTALGLMVGMSIKRSHHD